MGFSPCLPLPLSAPAAPDLAAAARCLGAPAPPDAQTLALLERVSAPVLSACAPRAVYRRLRADALAEAGLLQGADICAHLGSCTEAVLLAVTLGPGVDAQIRRASVGDVAAGAAADALASALAEQAADAAETALRSVLRAQGLYLTGRYSPGYGDWPLSVQPQLALLLDAPRQIGLCVTDTCLMTPRKSITALLGAAAHPVQGRPAGCAHCALRGKCKYQRRGQRCV